MAADDIDVRQEAQRLNEIADRERQTAINDAAEAGSEPAAPASVSDEPAETEPTEETA